MLNFKVFGEGDPVIILHGLFGTLDNWQTIGKALAENRMVYLVDQRNHGRSFHSEEFDYDLLAEDLRLFMESQWLYKADLIGHSMGGKTVMNFALKNPDMVAHLIAVDMSPVQYNGGHEEILRAMCALKLSDYTSRKDIQLKLLEDIHSESIVLFLLKNITRNKETGAFQWKMNLSALKNNYAKILEPLHGDPYEAPALFIRGEKSNYITAPIWKETLTLFPQGQLETVPNAGHWVHAEQPTILVKDIENWLDQ